MEVFSVSHFVPLAIGFFGPGTGYLIWGGQQLFGIPNSNAEVDKSLGIWAFWMPGFMQFITGVYIMVGLMWFPVFTNKPGHYMAALAFTAYGVHWFAMAHRKFKGYDETPSGWMAVAFTAISILGLLVFFRLGDIGVGILFVGLSLIYITEIFAKFTGSGSAARLVGLWQFLTGIWLMYLVYAVVFNTVLKAGWWM